MRLWIKTGEATNILIHFFASDIVEKFFTGITEKSGPEYKHYKLKILKIKI